MNKLDELKSITESKLVELKIDGQPSKLYAPINYILELGGKRIRPALVLAAYLTYDAELSADAKKLAAIVEMFHNFTLLHDDIMDGSAIRRGKPTVHKKWDEPTAILSGDLLQILVYQQLHQIQNDDIISDFDQMAIELCEGQMMDMEFETASEVHNDDYLLMIRKKTAVLLAYALKGGATLAGADTKQSLLMYEIGIHLGLSFQLMDDYLDAFGSSAKVGKRIGGDILEQKKTYLWNEMYRSLDSSKKAEIQQSRSTLSEEDYIEKVKQWMLETEAEKRTLDLAQLHHSQALQLIEELNVKNDLSYLKDILLALDQRSS